MTGYQNYARTSIETSDPRQVVVLLYEGAIKFLRQARSALDAADRAGMSTFIRKTQAIIHYLTNALDYENGGEVADNLGNLYAYMRDALAEANIKSDGAKIDEVIELIRPLLEAWQAIAHDPEAAAALQNRQPKAAPKAMPLGGIELSDAEAQERAQPEQDQRQMDRLEVAVGAEPSSSGPSKARPAPPRPPVSAAARSAYGIR